jgi:basic membrane protein A
MKAKRYLVAGAATALALGLTACGGSTGSTGSGSSASGAASDDSNCADAAVFCIGLVTDTGKVDDKSFNQASHEGAKAAAAADGGFYKYVETQDAKDYAANMAQFTNKKYDVVVTVGFLMTDATAEAAAGSPDTKFIGVDQFFDPAKVTAKNLTGIQYPEDQAGYGAGYLAGLMTKTNKIGQVLGLEIPPVQKFAKGYEAGAKAANDPTWGAAEAKKQLDQGADFIFGAGGNTGNGALQEVAKATGAGDTIFCIGVDTDQWDTVPAAQKCLITSATKELTKSVTDTIAIAKKGDFEGLTTMGSAGLAPFHDFDSKIPADVKTKVEKVVSDLKSGALTTGVTV